MERTYFRNLEVKKTVYQRHDKRQNKLEGKAMNGKCGAEHKVGHSAAWQKYYSFFSVFLSGEVWNFLF